MPKSGGTTLHKDPQIIKNINDFYPKELKKMDQITNTYLWGDSKDTTIT